MKNSFVKCIADFDHSKICGLSLNIADLDNCQVFCNADFVQLILKLEYYGFDHFEVFEYSIVDFDHVRFDLSMVVCPNFGHPALTPSFTYV